ncbi:MAG: DUF3397 domain-containing protein [Paenibacillus dendritiformis]|uniref:DUF3397 domain-containing protein n=1 Tax=Paenibacillus dendritiformis TaxID=130049 RepID=UPI00143D2160|nr:DUF3397 domain-containing protein [Paenibacillus dendritiformis]MDU5143138.1 DUF3397 domain-containing protein [Paenibacillus dendritiformis]NKI20766.1 DUF3397 domain-containing protein [Paenibacillus dendritiformis]NRF96756.1 DUF3397 domain-containing protein [Paenibacillus dendritiformis]GIO72379.1 hypothetical protein J27TS7_18930 [Paenibacillus dendritiformis]
MYTIFVFLSALPFFPFIIVWIAGSCWVRPKKKAFMLAMDVTTFFLIASVGGLYNTVTGSSAGFYWICLMLLLATGLLGGLQHRKYGKIHVQRLARTIWRLAFFILSILYILLLLIGIIAYIASV